MLNVLHNHDIHTLLFVLCLFLICLLPCISSITGSKKIAINVNLNYLCLLTIGKMRNHAMLTPFRTEVSYLLVGLGVRACLIAMIMRVLKSCNVASNYFCTSIQLLSMYRGVWYNASILMLFTAKCKNCGATLLCYAFFGMMYL